MHPPYEPTRCARVRGAQLVRRDALHNEKARDAGGKALYYRAGDAPRRHVAAVEHPARTQALDDDGALQQWKPSYKRAAVMQRIVWPRRLLNVCMNGYAANSGAMHPMKR